MAEKTTESKKRTQESVKQKNPVTMETLAYWLVEIHNAIERRKWNDRFAGIALIVCWVARVALLQLPGTQPSEIYHAVTALCFIGGIALLARSL